MSSSLTPEQQSSFERRGVVRLPGLLPAALVEAARAVVHRRLETLGLWQDGAWRLDAVPKPEWPASGIKSPGKVIGNKHPEFEALFATPALNGLVDELMEGRAVDRRIYPRPQLLITLPNADAWMLPPGWHTDAPRLASGRRPGMQAFALLEPTGPRGGGTLVVAGSHRLAEGRFMRAADLHRALGPEPFFRRWWRGTPTPWPDGEPLPTGAVQNLPVEVMELTGEPGDVWMMDLRTLHTGAPNAGAGPRVMITNRYIARDVTREIAEGMGWV
jgi:hypothetical protein